MKEKKKGLYTVILIIGIIIYLIFLVLMGPMRNEFISQYMGVLSALLVIITTIMVVTNRKTGFIVSCILSSFSALSAVTSMLRGGSIGALPGVFTPLINIGTMAIILTYLNISQKQAKELSEQYEKIIDTNRIIEEQNTALKKFAYTDLMTGMYNLSYFRQQMEELISRNAPFCIIYIDIDNFKSINDTFGPKTGDAALKIYADRVNSYCGKKYICARVSGDEFGILLPGEYTEADILNMIEQLRTMFSKQITAQLTSLSVTASFGIVVYPSDGNNTELLLDNAIIAVYNAKANGKDRPCFFSRTVNQSVYVPESVYAPQSTYIPESKYYPTE